MKMKKKWLGTFLGICLAVTMMPTVALAEDTTAKISSGTAG
ncbi:hypothetical protein M2454_002873 [Aequitasia blattaphilus]|nr:hypothetical protein [Aequitasia blattaphilus]